MNRVFRIDETLLLVGYVKTYFFHMRKRVDYTYQIFRIILDKDTKEKKENLTKAEASLRSRYTQLSHG